MKKTVDVKFTTARFTMDIMATTFFGIETNIINNLESEFFTNISTVFSQNMRRGFQFNAVFFLPMVTFLLKSQIFGRKAELFFKIYNTWIYIYIYIYNTWTY